MELAGKLSAIKSLQTVYEGELTDVKGMYYYYYDPLTDTADWVPVKNAYIREDNTLTRFWGKEIINRGNTYFNVGRLISGWTTHYGCISPEMTNLPNTFGYIKGSTTGENYKTLANLLSITTGLGGYSSAILYIYVDPASDINEITAFNIEIANPPVGYAYTVSLPSSSATIAEIRNSNNELISYQYTLVPDQTLIDLYVQAYTRSLINFSTLSFEVKTYQGN